jgi:uncharacterized membrane protein
MTANTLSPGTITRLLRALPVVGRIVRDVERDIDTVFYLVVIFVTGVVLAIQTWGLPALVMVALACVPVMFVVLAMIAKP